MAHLLASAVVMAWCAAAPLCALAGELPGAVVVLEAALVKGAPVIRHADVVAGNAPLQRPSLQARSPQSHQYVVELLHSAGVVLFAAPLHFLPAVQVPMQQPGAAPDAEPPVVYKEQPDAAVVMPYHEGAAAVRVRSEARAKQKSVLAPLPAPPSQEQRLRSVLPAPAEKGKLHILIIASGYSAGQMSSFRSRAESIETQLLQTAPFSDYAGGIAIHAYENTADLSCEANCYGIDRLMCCNSSAVLSAAAASGHQYDEIIVVDSASTYSGGGSRDYGNYTGSSSSTYCQVYSGSYTAVMAVHELGHSFANLCDEYSYGSEGYSYYDCVNCRASCADWASISSGCQSSCDAKSNYYHPENSVMLSLSYETFNAPSRVNGIEPRLQYFIGSPAPIPALSSWTVVALAAGIAVFLRRFLRTA